MNNYYARFDIHSCIIAAEKHTLMLGSMHLAQWGISYVQYLAVMSSKFIISLSQ